MNLNNLLYLITISTSLLSQACTYNLNNFFEECQEYKINGKWVTNSLLDLDYQNGDFEKAVDYIINNLTCAENRNFYFDIKNNIDYETILKDSAVQCKLYDDFFKSAYVSLKTGKITTNKDPDFNFKESTNLTLIFAKQKKALYYQFYAFYIDSLTHLFYELIGNIQYCANDKQELNRALSTCSRTISKMEYCIGKLAGSSMQKHYRLAVTALRQVLTIQTTQNSIEL